MLNLCRLLPRLPSLCVDLLRTVTSFKWQVARVRMRHIILQCGTPLTTCNLKLATVRITNLKLATALIATCTLPLATVCSAQTGFASISGRVADHSGAVIQKANVTLKNLDTGIVLRSETNTDGIYGFPSVQPGSYVMRVEKVGFRSVDVTGLTLYTQDQLARNFSLEVGSTSESITVTANATNDSPAISLVVNRDFVENMPLNGNSLDDLIALAPGVASSSAGNLSINGQRTDANYFTLDGVAANVYISASLLENAYPTSATGGSPAQTALGTTQSLISVDALDEFKIETSSYDAELGRQPGGQVQFTSRSGTDTLHGSAYDYLRNTDFDANDWERNLNGIPQQPERQNDFGGTLGGALTIPHIYDGRSRTFYFASYEGLRLLQPNPAFPVNVASADLRQFSAAGARQILNSQPIASPSADNGDECALSLGYTFSCSSRYITNSSFLNAIDSPSLRLDQAVGTRGHLFVRYADTSSNSGNLVVSQKENVSGNSHAWTLGSTAKVSPNVSADVRYNYTYTSSLDNEVPAAVDGSVPFPETLFALPEAVASGTIEEYPSSVTIPGMDNINNSLPQYEQNLYQQSQQQVTGSLTWSHGLHAIKGGIDYRRLAPLIDPFSYASRVVFFSISGLEQDVATAYESAAFDTKTRPTINNVSIYLEDQWKATQRLSLTYGLRWEFNPPPGPSNGIYPVALTTGNLATATLAPAGTPQYATVYHDFAPRLGIALRLGSSIHPLVLRAGGGIFFDTGQQMAIAGYFGYPFGSATNISFQVPFPPSTQQETPPPVGGPLTPPYGEIRANDPHLVLPYTEEWSLAVDSVLSSKNTATASYVGNSGRKLLYSAAYGLNNTPPINPLFTSVLLTNNAAGSSYNAFNLQDRGYLAHGLEIIAAYTFAHTLDSASEDAPNQTMPQWGNSGSDIRQVVNLAMNYETPTVFRGRLMSDLTKGWLVATRFQAQSGSPIDVIQGEYLLSDGQTAAFRPDRIPGVPLYLHNSPIPAAIGGWALNYDAFSQIATDPNSGAPLSVSNVGRDAFHGPNFFNLNMSLQRDIPVFERLHADIRVDAFNVLNHPNPGSIDPQLFDGPQQFGIANGVQTLGTPNALYASGAARSLQFQLKLKF